MVRKEVIEWLKSIKEKYIHGGDDFYDHQRRAAIDYAIVVLENVEQPKTNADRIRAMSDEELMQFLFNEASNNTICSFCVPTMRTKCKCDGHCKNGILEWLQQPVEERT